MSFNGLILGQDVVTAACGLLNAGLLWESTPGVVTAYMAVVRGRWR